MRAECYGMGTLERYELRLLNRPTMLLDFLGFFFFAGDCTIVMLQLTRLRKGKNMA